MPTPSWKIGTFLFIVMVGLILIAFNFYKESAGNILLSYGGKFSRTWLLQEVEQRCTNITNYSSVIENINDMTPKQLALSNRDKPTKVPPYLDKGYLRDCALSESRPHLYSLLRWWIEFAAKHNIVWWIRDGTLIGATRHRDIVPWDSDMDLTIMSQFEPLLRNLSTPRGTLNASRVNIVTRPAEHCAYDAERLDCRGNWVKALVDDCSFCGPLARFFRAERSSRADLYMAGIDFSGDGGRLMLYDESHTEFMVGKVLYPLEWIFPLRNCSIMGLDVLCPRDTDRYLRAYYENYRAKYECRKKTWEKVT